MSGLEHLLQENYPELRSEECQRQVVGFVQETESVADRDPFFIKALCKVAEHVYKKEKDLPSSFFERVYHFNLEGLALVNDVPARYGRMEAHFHGSAAIVARALFLRTRELAWGERWQGHHQTSARLSKREPRYAMHAFGFAGAAAKALFYATQDQKWLKEWFESEKHCYSLAKALDEEIMRASLKQLLSASHQLQQNKVSGRWLMETADIQLQALKRYKFKPTPFLADHCREGIKIAKRIYFQTRELSFASTWIKACREARDYPWLEPDTLRQLHKIIGELAEFCFKHSNDLYWGEQWYEADAQALEQEVQPEFWCYLEGHLGDAARELYYRTGEVQWGKKWVTHHALAAVRAEGIDDWHMLTMQASAGTAAQELFSKTADFFWLRRAYEYRIKAIRKNMKESFYLMQGKRLGDIAVSAWQQSKNPFWLEDACKKIYESSRGASEKAQYCLLQRAWGLVNLAVQKCPTPAILQEGYYIALGLARITARKAYFQQAGRCAEQVFQRFRDKEWGRRALYCYELAKVESELREAVKVFPQFCLVL